MSITAMQQDARIVSIEDARRPTDNRAHQRHLTIMRVAKFVYNGREGLGVVRNLSASGMKIDAYLAIEVGQPLTVSLTDGHHLDATVIWQQDNSVGIKFDQPASVEQLLAIPVKAERGKAVRPPRVAAGHSALLRWSNAAPAKVEIADLSQRGAKILTTAPLKVNNDVSLELAGLPPLAATIRWTRPGSAGLAFHQVLSVKALMAWLSASMPEKAES